MFFKKKDKALKAYANGKMIPITQVEDQVFSQKIMGDGLAIFPDDNKIYAPCDGQISAVFEQTQHAVGITLKNGIELILHVGLDTVNLTEPVFQTVVKMNEQANAENFVVPEIVDRIYFFNPFSLEILQKVIFQILDSYYANPRTIQLFFYYISDEYISYLMTVEELMFLDEIDCTDLFPEKNPRERIVLFEL